MDLAVSAVTTRNQRGVPRFGLHRVQGSAGITRWSYDHEQEKRSQRLADRTLDLLLADAAAPRNGLALECKRIKVRTSTDGDQRINKLDAFGASYNQANALYAIGFGRTFLTAISVVDGRFEPDRNFVFRGTSPQTFHRVFDTAMGVPLDEGVGVLYMEIAQPVSAPIQSAAVFSVAVIREAERRDQSSAITGMVAKYLETNGRVCAPWP